MKSQKINQKFILGIDIAKATFQAALCDEDSLKSTNPKFVEHSFSNDKKGFNQLHNWVKKHAKKTAPTVHLCMEATGNYWLALALEAHSWATTLSVVNALKIKRFTQMKFARSKTDPADARLIAQFCASEAEAQRRPAKQNPAHWSKPTELQLELKELSRRYDSIQGMITAEKNRLAQTHSKSVQKLIRANIKTLRHQQETIREQMRNLINTNPKKSPTTKTQKNSPLGKDTKKILDKITPDAKLKS